MTAALVLVSILVVAVIVGFATGIRTGPATATDETSQKLHFVATPVNPSFFAVQPTIDSATGDLTYTTAADAPAGRRIHAPGDGLARAAAGDGARLERAVAAGRDQPAHRRRTARHRTVQG